MLQTLAQALPFLLQTAPAVQTGMKGRNLKPQKQIASRMAGLADAQVNMDNPAFQRLYAQERDEGQQDLASTIAEISRQNRKLTSMGRKPLLDQERGGETVFRNLMRGYQDVGREARGSTFDRLRGGQDAYAQTYDAYNDLTNGQWQNDLSRVGAYYSIGDALKGLFGLNNQPETINWNSPRRMT